MQRSGRSSYRADEVGNVVAVAVGVPRREMVGIVLPGHIVAAGSLLGADRCPRSLAACKKDCPQVLQRRPRAAAVVEIIVAINLRQVGDAVRLDHGRRRRWSYHAENTNRPVTI